MSARAPDAPRVAYIMSRFPRLTETFILYEILALDRHGLQVEVYPLMRERKTRVHPDGASPLTKAMDLVSGESGEIVMHPEARALLPRVHYSGLWSWPILRALGASLLRQPLATLSALGSVVVHNLGSLNYLLGGLAIFPKSVFLGQQMRRAGITHVHAHFANHPTTAAYVIKRLTGIGYSFTGHGADLQVDQHMLRQKIEAASFVRAIAEDGRRFLEEHAPRGATERLVVVPCGVDVARFAEPDGSLDSDGAGGAHGGDGAGGAHDGRAIRLLCVATMYEVKGHRYLFEAIARLVESGRDVHCRLAGDGPDRAALEAEVARLGLADRIEFSGQQTRDQVVDLMRAADVLVVPSVPTASGRREGLPVVIMEAMAAGLPVVASGISGIPEIVRDGSTGLLVPPRDHDAIARAVVRLADDADLRRRLIDGGRRLVRETYDFEVVSGRLIELFRSASPVG